MDCEVEGLSSKQRKKKPLKNKKAKTGSSKAETAFFPQVINQSQWFVSFPEDRGSGKFEL